MPQTPTDTAKGPLEGIRVLDLTRVLAGPFCAMILGDLGAEIIKVEEVEKGDPARAVSPFQNSVSHYDLAVNRNKKGIAIDVRTPDGREVLLDLVRHSDVLLENFRPDVMEKLGLTPEVLRAANPGIVLCSVSGFGKGVSLSGKPSFDIIAQAMSGVMSVNGEPGAGPLKLGIPLGDLGAGMWAAIGVLAALQHRARGGTPLAVDVSMLDALIAMLGTLSQYYLVTGENPEPTGNGHTQVVPYGAFETGDGQIILALHLGSFWRKFCAAVDRPDWIDDPRYRKAESRRINRVELEREMTAVLKTRSATEWATIFEAHDLPTAAVLPVSQALAQPVVEERGLLRGFDHPVAGPVRVVGPPLQFDRSFAARSTPTPSPTLGQHTGEVLGDLLGYDAGRLDRLAAAGIINLGDRS